MLRFTFKLYFFITVSIYLKNYLLPTTLFFLIPLSDFRSTLFELIILIFGVMILFLFFLIGWDANRFFPIQVGTVIFASHIIFLPSIFIKWIEPVGPLVKWNELFLDLIAEPYRLLAFSYHASDLVGMIVPIILFVLGVIVRAYEEKHGAFATTQRILKMER